LVHKAVPHSSAYKHATGEAKYCDDVPKFSNELELAFVLSTKAHAKILNIDYSEALEIEGVVGHVSHEDLAPEKNWFGLVVKDEEIFASKTVTC
jgi:xanthine dehydrogenase/oxidase